MKLRKIEPAVLATEVEDTEDLEGGASNKTPLVGEDRKTGAHQALRQMTKLHNLLMRLDDSDLLGLAADAIGPHSELRTAVTDLRNKLVLDGRPPFTMERLKDLCHQMGVAIAIDRKASKSVTDDRLPYIYLRKWYASDRPAGRTASVFICRLGDLPLQDETEIVARIHKLLGNVAQRVAEQQEPEPVS